MPSVSVGGVVGMTAAVIASIVESIGDYHTCAKMSERTTPPVHAVSRAVACEGVGCILAGVFGTSSGTASYTGNIILVGITRVASRRVIQVSGLLMLLTGMCGKLCSAFATIPLPVLGSCLMFMFALVTGVGLSPLQHVNLKSKRNLFVIGFPIFIGLAVPGWLEQNPGAIQTGWQIVDQGLISLLKTSMFLGGMCGMILDNTIPGTIAERGLTHWDYYQQSFSTSSAEPVDPCYDFPFGMTQLKRWKWTRWVPFLPTFSGFHKKQQPESP
ncbi:Solute carrier family 23 member 1 [Chionoecetes opilio]|uniref:Solute carrier family 23 member 1 n=1 Tax=Chionoecetes opilio TaxID=41210 RepID=A0A8J4XY32_CHIOP|nr:Solute carrier family 23 member 1 [Chionoecetes opilio]